MGVALWGPRVNHAISWPRSRALHASRSVTFRPAMSAGSHQDLRLGAGRYLAHATDMVRVAVRADDASQLAHRPAEFGQVALQGQARARQAGVDQRQLGSVIRNPRELRRETACRPGASSTTGGMIRRRGSVLVEQEPPVRVVSNGRDMAVGNSGEHGATWLLHMATVVEGAGTRKGSTRGSTRPARWGGSARGRPRAGPAYRDVPPAGLGQGVELCRGGGVAALVEDLADITDV